MKAAAEPGNYRQLVISYLYTATFCAAVVVLLQVLGIGGTWTQSAAVSYAIGGCIHTAFVLLTEPFSRYMPMRFVPIPVTGVGLVAGLLLGGWFAAGQPLYFFVDDDYTSIMLGVFFGILGFIFFTTRDDLVVARAELAEAKADIAEQEKQRMETELRLLQAQIEPHFLFNTLSNVISLIRTEPERAEATLLDLTRFLRSSLKRSRQADNSLADELDIVRAYLSIQQTRMGNRLAFDIQTDGDMREVLFPPLLLQPLVENAVIHGIEPAEEGGRIDVVVAQKGKDLTITVRDDGVGLNTSSSGHQVGLRNIRERLHSLYGASASLTLEDAQPHGLVARLHLPGSR